MPPDPDWNHPLLITGCPRTGSTALTRGLSTHPNFCLFNEYHLYLGDARSHEAWDRIMTMPPTNRPPEHIGPSAADLRRRLRQSFPEKADNRTLRRWLFEQADPLPRIYGDKTPMSYLHNIESIARLHPGARCLITLRDGRDVIASQMRAYRSSIENGTPPSFWMKETVREAQALWSEAVHLWFTYRRSPPIECLEVRYEEAVHAPEALVKRICEFTGVHHEPGAFRGFFSEYVPTRVGSWRVECPDMEKHLSRDFRGTLEVLGYE